MKLLRLFTPVAVLFSLLTGTLTSCNKGAEYIDYAHNGSIKLDLEYSGKSFLTDGIEQVTLRSTIDGDTAHFDYTDTNEDGYLKARFYGIDTPESTGSIEPFGKGASNYTSEKLNNANENGTIVISSPQTVYGAPQADSTGSRYVSLVWINEEKKDAPIDELYLLNLMIVQDGWSYVKNLSDMPKYVETFYNAQEQAKSLKLNLYSGEDDPLYNYGSYQDTSLLDLKNEVIASLKDESHENAYDNAKVRVCGTVAAYSNNIIYLTDYFPAEDDNGDEIVGQGEYAGINVYTGMSSIPSKFTTIGTYIQLCGTASDSENFGFQIAGATFRSVAYDENDAKVLIKAENNVEEHALYTFQYTPDQLNTLTADIQTSNYESLYCRVTITEELTVYNGYDDDDGGAFTLYFKDSNGNRTNFSSYVTSGVNPDPDDTAVVWNTYEKFLNHKVTITGVLTVRKTSSGKYQWNVNPGRKTDIVVNDYQAE